MLKSCVKVLGKLPNGRTGVNEGMCERFVWVRRRRDKRAMNKESK